MLEKKIGALVAMLHEQEKHILADTIEKYWDVTVRDYSHQILDHDPVGPLEKELLDSFREELVEQKCDEITTSKVLDDIVKHRVIQTTPHSQLAQTPRMFCIDWITTAALPSDRWYIVGTFSGVPFSNSWHPARMRYTDQEINFIPKTMQDALVYSSSVPEKALEQYERLPNILKSHIPRPIVGAPFSGWTCRSAEALDKILLGKENIFYLDINNVITRYLLKIIDTPSHPISQILFDPNTRSRFFTVFGADIHLFYAPYASDKYSKQESLYFDGYDLTGKHTTQLLNPEQMREALESKKICPAAILVFAILAFINHTKCLGSFAQIEYLPRFQKQWQEMGFHDTSTLVPTRNLTTGMFPSDPHIQVLDLLLTGKSIPGNTSDLMGEYWLPIWETEHVYVSKQGQK